MEGQTRPRLTPGKLGYRNVVPAAPKNTPFLRSQSEGTGHILPMNRLLQIVRHPVSVIGKLGEGLFDLWNFWIHLALDFERKKSVCVVITDRSLTGLAPLVLPGIRGSRCSRAPLLAFGNIAPGSVTGERRADGRVGGRRIQNATSQLVSGTSCGSVPIRSSPHRCWPYPLQMSRRRMTSINTSANMQVTRATQAQVRPLKLSLYRPKLKPRRTSKNS
jgi:hypothetical protein